MPKKPENENVIESVEISDLIARQRTVKRKDTLPKACVLYFLITGILSLVSPFTPLLAMMGLLILGVAPWLAPLAPLALAPDFAPDFFLYPLFVLTLAKLMGSKLSLNRRLAISVLAVVLVSFVVPEFLNIKTGMAITELKAGDKSIALPVALPETVAILTPEAPALTKRIFAAPAVHTVLVGMPETIDLEHTDPGKTMLSAHGASIDEKCPSSLLDSASPGGKGCGAEMTEKLSSASLILVARKYKQSVGWNTLNVTRVQLLNVVGDRLSVTYQRTWATAEVLMAPFLIGPPAGAQLISFPDLMHTVLGDKLPDIDKEYVALIGAIVGDKQPDIRPAIDDMTHIDQ